MGSQAQEESSTLFTTETRSTRRCTENADASVKSPCPPCLRGEQGVRPLQGALFESQDFERFELNTPVFRDPQFRPNRPCGTPFLFSGITVIKRQRFLRDRERWRS